MHGFYFLRVLKYLTWASLYQLSMQQLQKGYMQPITGPSSSNLKEQMSLCSCSYTKPRENSSSVAEYNKLKHILTVINAYIYIKTETNPLTATSLLKKRFSLWCFLFFSHLFLILKVLNRDFWQFVGHLLGCN